MPTQPTTRVQVSGYNFLVRRMEHAIVRRDVRMLFDPMRSQSHALAVGIALATLALAGCGVLALIRPQDKIGSNKIVVGSDSAAVYAVIGDRIHPALNLASARLAVGAPDKPVVVKDSELAEHPRGQLIGIPGAPWAMPYDRSGKGRTWSVCDVDDSAGAGKITTSVIVGDPQLGDRTGLLGARHALLVMTEDDYAAEQSEIRNAGRSADDHPVYLVYDGKRALVDRQDPVVVDGLGIAGVTPRPVSRGLLNAIPRVPDITPPAVTGMGTTPAFSLSDGSVWPNRYKVGSVVYVSRNEARQYYIVLHNGLQPVGEATANLVLNINNTQNDAAQIPPALQVHAPVSGDFGTQFADYPQYTPAIDTADIAPVDCLSWKSLGTHADRSHSGIGARLSLLDGRSLPVAADTKPVSLIPPTDPKNAPPQADTVYIAPGTGDFVQTTDIAATSRRGDSYFYIADTGIKFGIAATDASIGDGGGNDNAFAALGFDPGTAEPAPSQIVALLGNGPALDRRAAMVAHDGMTPDANATAVPTPQPG